jgi:mannose-6-phosphate isomerase-like protein (cupin superfamily)
MNRTNNKLWGTSTTVHCTEQSYVDIALIKNSGFCSRHVHHGMDNMFIVLDGVLKVVQYFERDLTIETFLTVENNQLTVPKGVTHQFFAYEDTTLVEIYTDSGLPVSKFDIVRWTDGGANWRQNSVK